MPRLIDFEAGDILPSKTWLEDLVDHTHFREAFLTDWGMERGGVHRVAVVTRVERPGAPPGTDYSIDREIDWRDRLVLVAYAFEGKDNENPGFPGNDANILNSAAQGVVLWYTGLGDDSYEIDLITSPVEMQLRVNPASPYDAILRITASATYTNYTATILLIATEQTSERSSPDTMPAVPYGDDGDAIEPIELNAAQDGAMLTQMRDADGADVEEDTLVSERLFPLGPAAFGTPGVPRKFEVERIRGTSGGFFKAGLMHRNADTAPYRARESRRQRVAGSLRRFAGREIADATTLIIDDDNDWRDRFIWFLGRLYKGATIDIRPGEADDDTHNAATTFDDRSGYTGSGDDGTGNHTFELDTNLLLYADEDDGSLKVKNASGARCVITLMIYASFPLGPRSPRSV